MRLAVLMGQILLVELKSMTLQIIVVQIGFFSYLSHTNAVISMAGLGV
tara:strand:+ start:1465 stop:1608 length:144 start_codon:yes stop_codon:yes gene_type:complete